MRLTVVHDRQGPGGAPPAQLASCLTVLSAAIAATVTRDTTGRPVLMVGATLGRDAEERLLQLSLFPLGERPDPDPLVVS